MNDFSEMVKDELKRQKKSISYFAKKMGFSVQYTYNLINRKGNKRWNEDSMQKACNILNVRIQYVNKSA